MKYDRYIKKRNPILTFYNSDKTNFHSFILRLIFKPDVFNEGSLVHFRQIKNSAEEIYQKRSS